MIAAENFVVNRYAEFLRKKLFGGEGERTEDPMEKQAYIDVLKAFDLPYDEEKQRPSQEAIARKMRGA